MTAAQLTIGRQSPGHQQHDAGAQALAAGTEQMLGRSLKDRMAGTDQAAQIAQQGLEVGLDGL